MTPALDVSLMLNGIHNSPQDAMRHATLTHSCYEAFVFPFLILHLSLSGCLSLSLSLSSGAMISSYSHRSSAPPCYISFLLYLPELL